MPSLGLHVHWHNGPTCRFVKLVVSHPLLQIVSNLVFLIFICTAMMIRVDVLTWFLLSIGDLVEQFPVVATFSRITCSFCSRYPKPMRRSSTLFLCWKRLAFQTLRESKKILQLQKILQVLEKSSYGMDDSTASPSSPVIDLTFQLLGLPALFLLYTIHGVASFVNYWIDQRFLSFYTCHKIVSFI